MARALLEVLGPPPGGDLAAAGWGRGLQPTEREQLADWIERQHLDGTLRGMSWPQMEAAIWTALAIDVDASQLFGAIMDAGSRRGIRAARFRLGQLPETTDDERLFALAGADAAQPAAPTVHEDDGGED